MELEPQVAVAALLSLADAEEFTATVIPLTWGLNGFLSIDDLTALHGRYGDGVLPWIASRIDADGVLSDRPGGLWWLLQRCDSPDAFDLAARVRGVGPVDARGHWHPTGDERGPLATWILERPEVGVPLLARRRATAPDELTVAALRSLLRADPRGVRTRIRAALRPVVPGEILGDLPGDLLADLPGGEKPALPASVRAALDAAPVGRPAAEHPDHDRGVRRLHRTAARPQLARPRRVRHRDAGDRPPPTAARSTTI